MRLAVPTDGSLGLKDVVSEVFARAKTFTIIDIEEGELKHIIVEENMASELKQGTGPIVAKTLKDKGVNLVITSAVGPGAKTLLEMSNIQMILVEPRVKVKEAVAEALKSLS